MYRYDGDTNLHSIHHSSSKDERYPRIRTHILISITWLLLSVAVCAILDDHLKWTSPNAVANAQSYEVPESTPPAGLAFPYDPMS